MPKQLLHRTQIGASIKQVAGKSMAQNVRRHPLGVEARFRRQFLQFLAETLARQMPLRAA